MAHIERTRAVVEAEERYDGRIIPTDQAELGRPVRIREDAVVEGSVYGESVETDAGATVDGSVMASESVEMAGGHVDGEVGTPGRVVAEDARIGGTVTGQRVRLSDCVVRGNVVGTNVILEDCIVLGLVTADAELTVERSLCYTFRGLGETVLDEATIVLPQAVTDGRLDLQSPVTVAGLGRLSVGDDDDRPHPEMTTADRYEHEGTTYLSLAPRVLNLEAVTERLDELETTLMRIVDDTAADGNDLDIADVLSLLEVEYESEKLSA